MPVVAAEAAAPIEQYGWLVVPVPAFEQLTAFSSTYPLPFEYPG